MIHLLDRVGSTQDEIHRLAVDGAPHGTVVVAAEQTGGRGTRGRGWSSSRGGLWLTVLLRPAAPPVVEGLSLRVGLAVAALLDRFEGLRIALKWPNDLLQGGRKLGGILCEARWAGDRPEWVAVGLGLNVRNVLGPELAGQAVSLEALGVDVSADDLAGPAAAAILEAGARSGPLTAGETAAFAARDWLRGREVTAPVAGVVTGVGPDGLLLVRTPAGTVVAVAQSVTPAALAPPRGSG